MPKITSGLNFNQNKTLSLFRSESFYLSYSQKKSKRLSQKEAVSILFVNNQNIIQSEIIFMTLIRSYR